VGEGIGGEGGGGGLTGAGRGRSLPWSSQLGRGWSFEAHPEWVPLSVVLWMLSLRSVEVPWLSLSSSRAALAATMPCSSAALRVSTSQ